MSTTITKDKTISTRVTKIISERAKKNLAKQGLTISEYLRLSLVKAANNEVKFISFLDSPEALQAKHEAEAGKVKEIGTITDFDKWIASIDEN